MDRGGVEVVQQHQGCRAATGEGRAGQDQDAFVPQPLQQRGEGGPFRDEIGGQALQGLGRKLSGDLATTEAEVVVVLDLGAGDDVADDLLGGDSVVGSPEGHRVRGVCIQVPAGGPGLLGLFLGFGGGLGLRPGGNWRRHLVSGCLLAHLRPPGPPKVMSPVIWLATAPWFVPRKSIPPDDTGRGA